MNGVQKQGNLAWYKSGWIAMAWGLMLINPLAVLAKGGEDNVPALPPVTTSYSVAITGAEVTATNMRLTGNAAVKNFAGREDAQYMKFVWGDGQTEVVKTMSLPNYLKRSSNFTISSWTKSHAYSTPGAQTVTIKIYHGSTTGEEAFPKELKSVTIQTENTLEGCMDRFDNDLDGAKDLNDSDCSAFKQVENTAALCSDNFDNDNNGNADLIDVNCVSFVPAEKSAEACSDGRDNDLDGSVDLLDADCVLFIPKENTAAVCADAQDNDLDTQVDLNDADCAAFRPSENTHVLCSDSMDNDFDGLQDGRDSDCVGMVPAENDALVCLDAVDNDFDGLSDWNDSDCAPFVVPADCPTGFQDFFIPGFGFICGAFAGY